MVEDFGSYLKSERELRGVTLEELHSKTRIPSRYLQALENNQFDELPEEVFYKRVPSIYFSCHWSSRG